MRASTTDWPVSDVLIVGASVVGLAVVSLLLGLEPSPVTAAAGTVGVIAERSGSVRHRPADSIVWDDAGRGDRLSGGEALFVGPGGAAAVALDDGGRLELEENSLVVLEARRSAGGPAARLDVAVLAGAAAVSGASAVMARLPVRLTAPRRSQRVWFAGAPGPVALAWDGAAAADGRVEVARDPGFAEPIATFAGARGAAEWIPPAGGTYWWRVVDARRAPRSEARAVVVAEDRPPLPFSPADGEVVFAPAGRTVPFWWTEVDAKAYVVEISAAPDFDEVALAVAADRPGAWIEPRLPEGAYHWRVRAADPERGRSPPSRRSAFRLVHASVPEAPELLDPTLQVERAGP